MSNAFRTGLSVAIVIAVITTPVWLAAAEPFKLFKLFTGKHVDVKSHDCEECDRGADGECIVRYPVEECVEGKKEVFDCKTKYEYVSVPETRYYWKKRKITKEIPCPYCHPVCKTEDGQNCFGQEKWEKYDSGCGEIHCRHIEPQIEKTSVKCCEHEPGETTVKVKYWSCVKVPYTVYRRVKQPVCVKQPRYEKVEVPVTRYVCEDCDSDGCEHGDGAVCEKCSGAACDQSNTP